MQPDNRSAAYVVRNVRSGLLVPASFKPGFPDRASAEAWIEAVATDPFAPVPRSEFAIEEAETNA